MSRYLPVYELHDYDLRHVVERIPRDLRDLLSAYPKTLMVGGGFIRSVIGREPVNDIDLFCDNAEWGEAIIREFAKRREARVYKSGNALTVLTPNRTNIQLITRWTFDNMPDLVDSFDFTVCQAAICRSGRVSNDPWISRVGPRFYSDLAAKRLHYTAPKREEEAGGSMLRVIKYVQRGYSIQVGSLGAVIARLTAGVPEEAGPNQELYRGGHIATRLREVDPALQVDGLEITFDHEADEPIPTLDEAAS
ncbi:hypothetical protein T8K17_11430 [Thalassobaculum sp. OXR-137]|uniref:hypothetical protein n=1 Tax=Thalassobaculum sp. OXR-137 TaxID=3100173 RepID=UPI002AC9AC90|nr:hypothetical protein [Thalassobaculum sp. OXR-137]WPZ36746.1 hypothetical protein T8K17_11430 [Thalassobaculum sp. OXR-137]